jgi:acetyl esterase/lipase
MRLRIAYSFVIAICAAVNGAGRADEPAPHHAITVLRNLRYRDGPSKQWQLDLAMPRDTTGKPRPAIVIIHGGGWLEGDRSSFASKRHGVPGNIEEFAVLGFVAVTINYRLSGEAPYPAALEDCRAAVRWLRAHAKEYHLDPAHIGAYGNSAGGHLALLLGMTGAQADRVQAVASDSGPIDLLYQYEHRTLRQVVSKFLGGPPEGERIAAYRQASPRHQISKETPPLLLIYGGEDEQVPVETADDFVVALHRAGLRDVTYHRLAYVGHCPHSLVRIPTMRAAVDDFFLRTLMYSATAQQVRRPGRPTASFLQRDNLVAWCIVPFDSKNRTPAERAAMVKRLGFTKVAYDWRDNHVASFEEEILQYRKHGLDYFAFWSTHEKAFALFAKYDLHPQIWQMLPSPSAATQEERIAAAVKQMLPLVERTAKLKCRLGLYNHGGWGGEPENLIAVCKRLREQHHADHVGIVYNLHHGHGHIKDFAAALAAMKPYLLCLNLNGMNTQGPQILPLGAGEHDVMLLKTIRDSGYRGPIGIIGHTGDDVEQRLRDNLDGLDWLIPQLDGKPAGPRPKYRTR